MARHSCLPASRWSACRHSFSDPQLRRKRTATVGCNDQGGLGCGVCAVRLGVCRRMTRGGEGRFRFSEEPALFRSNIGRRFGARRRGTPNYHNQRAAQHAPEGCCDKKPHLRCHTPMQIAPFRQDRRVRTERLSGNSPLPLGEGPGARAWLNYAKCGNMFLLQIALTLTLSQRERGL